MKDRLDRFRIRRVDLYANETLHVRGYRLFGIRNDGHF